ncbi:probable phosphoglycerate mutase [Butyrivibrio fibrisolvens]|uniref:Probable phosphoglycerate mutase n=1 Tax=Butyrivibrio fibrisolvens TaxID=831 RepID=A0A1H9WS16_BUTFI|nr:histidine phosphatase family protein [Butyrivibrio fibrisolvens]SES36614.1 probable phosphoglycerate mutase [Butyrivibrio fibrisolvens]
MKIYFARHGQTDWNTLRKVQGTTDIPLNENGIAQAHLLCKNLEENEISFEKIYTSYQARAVKTAQIVDEHFHTGYEIVKGLEEMNLGLFEGHTWDEILSLYSEEHKQWLLNKRYNRSPGGESYQMVMERLFKALDYILGKHDPSSDKNLLIISHGAVIMTLLAMKRNISFEQSHTIEVYNASPIEFSIEELNEIRERL